VHKRQKVKYKVDLWRPTSVFTTKINWFNLWISERK